MSYVGIDLVHVPGFAEQLNQAGTHFADAFHPSELRRAMNKPSREQHLAGCWAAKEAFIKAWSQSLYNRPPIFEDMLWSEIMVEQDQWGRVRLRQYLVKAQTEISISHDGDYATAVCLFTDD